MRLRPSGNARAGRLLARQLRALPAGGRPDLGASGADPGAGRRRRSRRSARRVETAIVRRALLAPRDAERAGARASAPMRERIFREHGSEDPWNLKHARGGLVETRVPGPVPEAALCARRIRSCSPPARSRPSSAPRRAGMLPATTAQALVARRPALPAAAGGAAPVGAGPLRCRAGAAGLRQALVARPPATTRASLPRQPHEFADLRADACSKAKRAVSRDLRRALPAGQDDGSQARRAIRRQAVDAHDAGRSPRRGGAEMTLEAGQQAPEFDLPADGGGRVGWPSSRASRSCSTSIPRTTRRAAPRRRSGFAAAYPEFKAAGVEVVGVSKDSVASHDQFKAKHDLPSSLASDEQGGVVEAFGAWVEKSMYGRKYMGIDRSTFLIDGDGRGARGLAQGQGAGPRRGGAGGGTGPAGLSDEPAHPAADRAAARLSAGQLAARASGAGRLRADDREPARGAACRARPSRAS